MSKIKRKVILVLSILLVGMILARPVTAQTSENLEWGVDVADMTYFSFYYWSEGLPTLDENLYVNITGPIDAIPDPLTNWSDIPDTLIDMKYLNGTDLGIFSAFHLFAWKMAVPIGNWSLMSELVENVTMFVVSSVEYTVQPNVTIDDWLHWGFSYNFSQTGADNVANVTFLKSDGFLSSMRVRGYVPDTNTLMGIFDFERDGTPPIINGPGDIGYYLGSSGNEISWSATDQSPAGFIIYKDDVEMKRGLWNSTSENLVVDIDGLAIGSYDYKITFIEASGANSFDEVTVTVSEFVDTTTTTTNDTTTTTTTTSETTGDFISENLMLIVSVGGGAVIIIVIVLIISKKN